MAAPIIAQLMETKASRSDPMTAIVRVAIIVVTLALFLGSSLNAMTGQLNMVR